MNRRPRDLAWFAAATPLLLAGLLPVDSTICQHWCLAGRWTYPVGDPHDLSRPGPEGEPAYQVTRNVGGTRSDRHAGADLSNRRGGDTVRIAAHGVVVSATDLENGYGLHVVVAHRQPDGSLVFSVYAHLAPRSVRVRAGETVWMGQPVGRVGNTGVATSPHLHFEVRRPSRWDERWEKSEALDPVRFVAARLPTRDGDSTWARPYLLWAECAGIIAPEENPIAPVSRERWQRVLAAARCRRDDLNGPLTPPPAPATDSNERVSWREIARDLERTRPIAQCLPPDSTSAARRHALCLERLGDERPARHKATLERRKASCTLADIALLLSDAAAP